MAANDDLPTLIQREIDRIRDLLVGETIEGDAEDAIVEGWNAIDSGDTAAQARAFVVLEAAVEELLDEQV